MEKGRFAPSPTGRMHLGNVYAALMSFLSVRRRGGKWLLRIEDIDPERSKRQYADLLLSDLDWLGLHWDEGPYYQSERTEIYQHYLKQLSSLGLLYPCCCTRAEIMSTQAPHESDGRVVYSGRCRPILPVYDAVEKAATLRVRVPEAPVAEEFVDQIYGVQKVVLAERCGDFVVRRRDGAWAYMFACAVDDSLMEITDVVRGEDLLLSTAQQRYLQKILQLPLPTTYSHIHLLRNSSGQRLSKRDGAVAMDVMRQNSTPTDVLATVCTLAGVDFEELRQYL